MGKKLYNEDYINQTAIEIQKKLGTTERFTLQQFPEKIASMTKKEKDVNFYDYDGELLYSYTVEEAQELTSLPESPAHDDLTFEGWNWTLEQIKALHTFVNVGANYITTDGATRLYIEVDVPCLQQLTFATNVADGITIDWGDGSPQETTSSTSMMSWTHNYEVGNYTIKLIPKDDTVTLTPSAVVIGSGNERTATKNMLKKFFCGQKVIFNQERSFQYSGVEAIALSRTITWGTWNLFRFTELKCLVFPPNKPIPNDACFAGCYNLKILCTALGSICYPFALFDACCFESFVDVGYGHNNQNPLRSQHFLKRVSVAVNITSCQNRIECTTDNFTSLKEIYLLAQTQVPTYASNFGQPYTKYYVPANLYDEWIATEGWSDIADRIIPVEL